MDGAFQSHALKVILHSVGSVLPKPGKLTEFYGARDVRHAVGTLCAIVGGVWTPMLRRFLIWLGDYDHWMIVWGLFALFIAACWIIVTVFELQIRVSQNDLTWLERILVALAVIVMSAVYAVLALVVLFCLGWVFFAIAWGLGKAAAAHWFLPAVLAVLIGGSLLYFLVLPLSIQGLREGIIRSKAAARWDQDVEELFGGRQSEADRSLEPLSMQRSEVSMAEQSDRPMAPSAGESGPPTLNMTWLPAGVVDAIRNLQETAGSSQKLRGIIAPILARLNVDSARMNLEKITELYGTLSDQLDAARKLQHSYGNIQRAEMEETLATLQLQLQLVKLQKELASLQEPTADDWAKEPALIKAEKEAEAQSKLLAIEAAIAFAEKMAPLRKRAQEIEDEGERKKLLAKIDAIYEEEILKKKDPDAPGDTPKPSA